MSSQATIEDLRERIALIERGHQAKEKTGGNKPPKQKPLTEEAAFRKIERVAMRREQSSRGMMQKLLHDGYPQDIADAALHRALRCGLIDDGRYAEVLVRSRLSQGKGREGIRRELEAQGIHPDSVEEFAESDLGHHHESQRAYAALDGHPPRCKNKRDGAYRFLIRKGFDAGIASSVAREWTEANAMCEQFQVF